MFRVVIPARYASTRLPGKPLLQVAGKPMLQWVHDAALKAGAAEVIVATDDERIVALAREFGAQVALTAAAHESGTDRIAEVVRQRGWNENAVVVNLQADEPLMPPALVAQVAQVAQQHDAAIATLASPIESIAALLDPHCVKVVTDAKGCALYFSRAPIPWGRDTAPTDLASQSSYVGARRHIGLYAYTVGALKRLTALPVGRLEQLEKLEQLRALEHGIQIRVADAVVEPGPDINTPQDLVRVAQILERLREPTK